MSRLLCVAVLSVFAIAPLCDYALAQHISPSDDTFVSRGRPAANFGSSGVLTVGADTISYMKFNLAGVPAGSTVSKATLRLFVDGVAAAGHFDVYNLPAGLAWSEDTLKYSTPPPALGTSATGGRPVAVSISDMSRFLRIDITATVQNWMTNPSGNNGVALAVTAARGLFSFDSKESPLASHEPELEIVLNDPSPSIDEPLMIHIKGHCTRGPSCASGACQTPHSDGLGQSYYNCSPLNTYTETTAFEAGTAYEVSIGGSADNVSTGWSCPNAPSLLSVCATNSDGDPLFCWGYEGSQTGQVSNGTCPWTESATWN
ncbi:MAG: DNRLRE domain-containing protein [Terriglobales bacterium]